MSEHAGGFTCAQVDAGSDHLAASVLRLRRERDAALLAYDAEVIAHREATRLLAELRGERERYRQAASELGAVRTVVEACEAIPDITISKWACDPGGHWNPLRGVLRACRAARGLDVDPADPDTAFDEHGWLIARRSASPGAVG